MRAIPKTNSCEAHIENEMAARLEEVRTLWDLYRGGKDGASDLGKLAEYGLCFDYVAPGTFDDQDEGYFRYQISWGGPSDEFRFFVNPDLSCHRIEYWFLDWFDGAHRVCVDDDKQLMMQLWQWLNEIGTVRTAFADR